jgi:hypothetical protein
MNLQPSKGEEKRPSGRILIDHHPSGTFVQLIGTAEEEVRR